MIFRLQDSEFEPFLENDHLEHYGKLWSLGFMKGLLVGLNMPGEALANIANDKKSGVIFFPILALAYDDIYRRPELDFMKEKTTPDLRRELVETLPDSVFAIRGFFKNRWSAMKVGRNDPCTCCSDMKT